MAKKNQFNLIDRYFSELSLYFLLFLNLNIVAQVPCSGMPAASSVTVSSTQICANTTVTMGVTGSYTQTGIKYEWYQSMFSAVGPFTLMAQGTASNFTTPPINTTVWLQGVVSCTNGGLSTSMPAVQVSITNTNITVNSPQVCQNQTTTLSANSNSTIDWYSSATSTVSLGTGSNFTIQPTSAGTSTYYAEATSSCSPVPNRVPVLVNVLPAPNLTAPNGTICNGQSFTFTPSGAASYTFPFSVSPTVTTNYLGYGTNTLGCTSTIIVTVTKLNLTPPTITAPGTLMCSGQNFTIMPSGALTYTFSNGGPVVSPTSSVNNYTITGTDINGCTNKAICTVSLVLKPVITGTSGTICIGNTFTINATGANTYSYSGGSNVVSPIASTIYTVTGYNSLGCSSNPINISVIVNTVIPTITANSGTICPGKTFTIYPSGGISYTINTGTSSNVLQFGGYPVSPSQSTSYTITGTNSGNCRNSTISVVNVESLSQLTITSSKNPICVGEIVKLTAQGAYAYNWSNWQPSPTATTNLGPSVTTSISVIGQSIEGCTNTAVTTITVDACDVTSLDENSISDFRIYPNPFVNVLLIDSYHETTIKLFNLAGEIQEKIKINSGMNILNLEHIEDGIYLLRISNKTVKLIKNKLH